MRWFCFGVGFANFGSPSAPTGEALTRIGLDPRVVLLATYRATGNYVVEAGSQSLVHDELVRLTDRRWAVVSEDDIMRSEETFETWPRPPAEEGTRWTAGLAFAVEPVIRQTDLTATKRGCFRWVNERVVAVYKRDLLMNELMDVKEGAVLDPRRRQGGWGGVSADVAKQAGGTWTSRSRSVIDGLRRRAGSH